MALTLLQAQAELDKWLMADAALASGAQSATIQGMNGARSVTQVNAAEIRQNIIFWESKCARLTRGNGLTLQRVTPIE